MGDKYIDELDQVWELIDDSDLFVLRRIEDGYIEYFESLDSFDRLTDGLW